MKILKELGLTLAAFVAVILLAFIFDEAEAGQKPCTIQTTVLKSGEIGYCRSQCMANRFAASQGGRKGGVVDHVCSLYWGGVDRAENMQIQSKADSKTKDRVENTKKGRDLFCNDQNSLPYRTVYNCKK